MTSMSLSDKAVVGDPIHDVTKSAERTTIRPELQVQNSHYGPIVITPGNM